MNKARLYTCGIAWSFETVIENAGELEFYTSVEALKEHHPMWKECGVAAIDGTLGEWVVKPMTVREIADASRKKHKDFERKEREQDRLRSLLNNDYGIEVIRRGTDCYILISRLTDHSFHVQWEANHETWNKQFAANEINQAVQFFVQKRYELKIGTEG